MTALSLLEDEVAMDVKEAAKIAAEYTADMETITRPDNHALFLTTSGFAIEAVHFDEKRDCWQFVVGFVRPEDKANRSALSMMAGGEASLDRRTYKAVAVSNADGKVLSYEARD